MNDILSTNNLVWGVFPYVAITLFFVVPFLRMIYRPFGLTTRPSGIFMGRDVLGLAAHLLHWGIFLVFFGHLAGLIGGIRGWEGWVNAFFWMGTLGGIAAITGSIIALVRRSTVPEMRAMSQPDDYIVHLFLIAILGVAIYQAVINQIWGVAFTAGPWFASLWRFDPQPELMAGASTLTKLHIFLAFAFAAYFPFTKLIHAWTLPVNYFVRPYQVMRTTARKFQDRWEFKLVSDKSYMTYLTLGVVGLLVAIGAMLPGPSDKGLVMQDAFAMADPGEDEELEPRGRDVLMGYPLYISQCARCHGLEGEGDGVGARSPTFDAKPRDLTSGHFQFISTNNGIASEADIKHVIVNGLQGSGMPGFASLSDDQVDSLVGVVRSLSKERLLPGERIAVPPRPPVTNASLAQGKQLYANLCAVCHGENGDGEGVLKALRTDAAGNVVPPRNLRIEPLKGGPSAKQLYYRIAAGMPRAKIGDRIEWLMPSYPFLSPEQVWALVDYLEADILPPNQFAKADNR